MTVQEAKNKVIGLARQEVGYRETGDNCVKYNQGNWDDKLYGWNTEGQPWCDIFFDWLFVECFGLGKAAKMTYQYNGCCGAACAESANYYKNNGQFYRDPKVGDQIFFYYGGAINHTGIVERLEGAQVVTIEGNSSDQVKRNFYPLTDGKIAGYGRPNWNIVAEDETTEEVPEPDLPSNAIEMADGSIAFVNPVNVNVDIEKELEVHICRPGEYSYWVFAMQYLLKENGYYVQGDGYFAIDTSKKVIQCQKDNNLEVDCQCGFDTWNALFKDKEIMITDEGFAVRAMQYLLKAQDYFVYTDGIFGSQAYQQLVKFQQRRGITDRVGVCTTETWNELIKH